MPPTSNSRALSITVINPWRHGALIDLSWWVLMLSHAPVGHMLRLCLENYWLTQAIHHHFTVLTRGLVGENSLWITWRSRWGKLQLDSAGSNSLQAGVTKHANASSITRKMTHSQGENCEGEVQLSLVDQTQSLNSVLGHSGQYYGVVAF